MIKVNFKKNLWLARMASLFRLQSHDLPVPACNLLTYVRNVTHVSLIFAFRLFGLTDHVRLNISLYLPYLFKFSHADLIY